MTGPGRPIPPAEIARVDQIAAELAGIVAAARRHMAGCPTVPAGLCIGDAAGDLLRELTCQSRFVLLEEAVAQLARATGPAEDGERP